jgi:hypothetical protein
VNFDTTTRHIFFNGNIAKSDKSLINFYKNSKYLSLDPPPEGYTIYPPLSALGQAGPHEQFVFRFKTHPYISFKFKEGELIISLIKTKYSEKYSAPVLKFIFTTKQQSELAYQELVETFNELSTRKRFSSYKNTKNAEFTDDSSKSLKEIGFLQGEGDILTNGYVIVFGLGNDLDIDKK